MPKRGGKRKKTRTHKDDAPEGAHVLGEGALKEVIPKSIIAKASKIVPHVAELITDLRKLMSPNTASSLREKSYNRMKDYVAVAGQLGVSHLLAMSQTKSNIVLRIARFPTGPTLHFRVKQYTLSRLVRASQKRPYDSPKAFMTAPLVVLNNFGQSEESQVKLMRATFQNMFPSINVKTIKLSECRRVVLFHFIKEEGTVEVRHFAVRAAPVGISRSVKRILQAKIPDLSKLEDVSEFLEGHGLGAASDSEGEDETTRVVLPEKFVGRGNSKAQQSAMKLVELGPRLKLEIFKVERGINEGDVLYHKFEQKTAAEEAATKLKIEKLGLLKSQRRAEQDANVKRKREAEVEAKAKKLETKKRKIDGTTGDDGGDEEEEEQDEGEEGAEEEAEEGSDGEEEFEDNDEVDFDADEEDEGELSEDAADDEE